MGAGSQNEAHTISRRQPAPRTVSKFIEEDDTSSESGDGDNEGDNRAREGITKEEDKRTKMKARKAANQRRYYHR